MGNKEVLVGRILEFRAGGSGTAGGEQTNSRIKMKCIVYTEFLFFSFSQETFQVTCMLSRRMFFSQYPRVEKECRPRPRYNNEPYDDGIIIIFVNPYKLHTLLPGVRF